MKNLYCSRMIDINTTYSRTQLCLRGTILVKVPKFVSKLFLLKYFNFYLFMRHRY